MTRALGPAARVGGWLVTALLRSARIERRGVHHYQQRRREGRGTVFVFRHRHLLPLVHVHRGEGIAVLVSEHRDGELVARVIARRGFALARGSSTRGGVRGLRALVAAASEGRDLAVTPDGPRGPAGIFKPGAFLAAKLSGAAVVPIAVSVDRAWEASSWDGFLIPKPFSRVRVTYLPARKVPADADRSALASLAARISDEIDRAAVRDD